MTFPKRWMDDEADATSAVRDVLRAGRRMDPPDGAEKAVWLALVGQIGAAGAGGAAAAGASAKAASAAGGVSAGATAGATAAGVAAGGGLLKAILIGAFSGVIAVTGYSAIEPAFAPPAKAPPAAVDPAHLPPKPPGASGSPAPAAPAASASAAAVSSSEPREPAASAAPAAPSANNEPSGSVEPPSVVPAPESPSGDATPLPGGADEREARLREEREMLHQARTALRAGDTAGAMRFLQQSSQKFPGGMLGQEREALVIETLAKSGAREAASVRAAAFIKAHPTSPHAARLQAFVQ